MKSVKSMSLGTCAAQAGAPRVALLSSGVEETAKAGDDPVAVFRAIRSRTKPLNDSGLKALIEEGRA